MDGALTYAALRGFAFTDLPQFVTELERFFCSQRPVQVLMNPLLKFKQEQRSVQEYASEFVPLASKANTPYDLAQHLFLRGLNRKYHNLVVLTASNVLSKHSTRNFVHQVTANLITKDAVTRKDHSNPATKPSQTAQYPQRGLPQQSASPSKESCSFAPGPRPYPTAMDFDRGPRKLPPHELARRVRKNLCKRCRSLGHYAASCPLGTRPRQQAAVAEQEGVPLNDTTFPKNE